MFIAQQVASQLVVALASPIEAIHLRDKALAGQLRRSGSSVLLNILEGNRRVGRDRQHLFHCAAGSAAEVAATLEVAATWGYLDAGRTADAVALVDRELRLLAGLTRRSR